ncbi:fibrillarin-like rRNA/tRNA 2'-O-methyltransferase [Candidatus Woesearchaeota archaeon]|nr:MAG: fibrillarin-like rRNA/tRNA 2'-O-methyltransferase [Candidatus Woesearchaeota archaeon]
MRRRNQRRRTNTKLEMLGKKFPNIYSLAGGKGKRLFTESLTGKESFPEETLIRMNGKVFREWEPERSKLAAAIMKDISQIGIREGMNVLYLGAAHGYTVSFISDIIRTGMIFAVEKAPQVVRELILVSAERKNVAPVLADAQDFEELGRRVPLVDFVYQDIAQQNQTEIFTRSCRAFLKPGHFGMLAVKARSIDVSRKPKEIFNEVRRTLERELVVVDYRYLDPFEKDHCLFVCKKRN